MSSGWSTSILLHIYKIQGIVFQKTVISRNGTSVNKNVTPPLSCYLPSTEVEKYGCLMSSADRTILAGIWSHDRKCRSMLCRVIEQLVPDILKSHIVVIVEDNLVMITAVRFCRTSGTVWHFHIPRLETSAALLWKPQQHCCENLKSCIKIST